MPQASNSPFSYFFSTRDFTRDFTRDTLLLPATRDTLQLDTPKVALL